MDNLELPVFEEEENAKLRHRERAQCQGLNPQPSCYEVTALTTVWPIKSSVTIKSEPIVNIKRPRGQFETDVLA